MWGKDQVWEGGRPSQLFKVERTSLEVVARHGVQLCCLQMPNPMWNVHGGINGLFQSGSSESWISSYTTLISARALFPALSVCSPCANWVPFPGETSWKWGGRRGHKGQKNLGCAVRLEGDQILMLGVANLVFYIVNIPWAKEIWDLLFSNIVYGTNSGFLLH